MTEQTDRDALAEEIFNGAPAQEVAPEAPEEDPAPQEEVREDKDPWDGVPAVLRERLESIGSTLEQVSHRVKTAEGRVGAIQGALAKQATAKPEAPSPAQVEAAQKDDASWAALREDFPEWTDAVEKKIAAQRADFTGRYLTKEDAQAAILSSQQEIRRQVEEQVEKRIVAVRHPGYEETLKTKDFWGWFNTQKEDLRRKASSTKAEDAIEILDAYKASKTAKPTITEQRKERLERAVPVSGIKQAPIKSEADMTPEELRQHLASQIWGG